MPCLPYKEDSPRGKKNALKPITPIEATLDFVRSMRTSPRGATGLHAAVWVGLEHEFEQRLTTEKNEP